MPSYVSQWREIRTCETYRKLGAAKSQALLQKLDEAWKGFFALLRKLKEGKLPPNICHPSEIDISSEQPKPLRDFTVPKLGIFKWGESLFRTWRD